MNNRLIGLAIAIVSLSANGAATQTLKAVKERGSLTCGVSEGLPGFSAKDDKSQWSGFDVDFCRALAAAIFNDVTKVNFVPLSASDRFDALRSNKIDVLSRNSTWTMERETGLGLLFSAVTYYDGQGFMVRRSPNIESALELAGKTVCTQAGTTTELNAADYFRNNRLTAQVKTYPTVDDALKAYSDRTCDAFTADSSQLHALLIKLDTPRDHLILPNIVSKEPLGANRNR